MLCALVFVVAFAALSAFDTSTQFPDTGEVVEFNDVVTEVGATTNFTGSTFTCPSTAFYLVHYRLLIRGPSFGSSCRVDLHVGSEIREVSFNIYFNGKA